MGSTTGIELGPDFCVLVAVRPRGAGSADVLALHCIERSEWPLRDTGVTDALRAARAAKKFPRRARLVVWGLPEGATRDDPATAAILRPVTAAGFRADAILTPPQALAALAASRPRPGASGPAAWLAVNVHGAAIAIVRGQELLFSRTLEWSYNPVVTGSRAQLLQRYSLVAQLAPEIRHGIAAVQSTHRETVGTVITCGDLPELRSLTMPLIEELDLEVETLDSTDGLKAVGRAKMERFAESAPALRLACAAALPASSSNRGRTVGWLPVAAGIALLVVAGWGVLAYTNRGSSIAQQAEVSGTAPVVSQGRSNSAVPQAPLRPAPAVPESKPAGSGSVQPPVSDGAGLPEPRGAAPRSGSPFVTPPVSDAHPPPVTPKSPGSSPAVPSASSLKPAPSTPTAAPSIPSASSSKPAPAPLLPPAAPSTPAASSSKPAPVVTPPPAPSSKSAQSATLPPPARRADPSVGLHAGSTTTGPAVPGSKPAPAAVSPAVPAKVSPTVNPPVAAREPALAPKVVAAGTKVAPAALPKSREPSPAEPVTSEPGDRTVGKRAVPLKEPLPRLDSILIDQDRRLAVIDGVVVHPGDSVGARVVAHIARDGVLLREPSGLVVRLPLR